jgi:ADP-ribose pyrophosphatase YjhB (NUDIX family)
MTGDGTRPCGDFGPKGGRCHLREIECETVSILMLSRDDHLLMGKKGLARKWVHHDAWHLPGGEVREGELLIDAAIRRIEETVELHLTPEQLTALPFVGLDEHVKTLDTGETVWCRMKLNRFEVRLNAVAAQLGPEGQIGGDLMALRWVSPEELAEVDLIPSVRQFLIRTGHIPARRTNSSA